MTCREVNKPTARQLHAQGCEAVGLSLLDRKHERKRLTIPKPIAKAITYMIDRCELETNIINFREAIVMRSVFALATFMVLSSHVNAGVLNLQLKQQELRAMLKSMLVDHFGITDVEMHEVDSDTTFAIQVYYPNEHSDKIVGQAGGVIRSIKILFNEMYLTLQQRIAEANKDEFDLEQAKKLYIKFIPHSSTE